MQLHSLQIQYVFQDVYKCHTTKYWALIINKYKQPPPFKDTVINSQPLKSRELANYTHSLVADQLSF